GTVHSAHSGRRGDARAVHGVRPARAAARAAGGIRRRRRVEIHRTTDVSAGDDAGPAAPACRGGRARVSPAVSRATRGQWVMVTVEIAPTFESWQAAARALVSDGVGPGDVDWRERPGAPPPPNAAKFFRVPPKFLDLARQAASVPDAARWGALYDVLWRIVNERRDLLEDRGDPMVRRLHGLAARARREAERVEQQELLRLEAEGGGAAAFVPAGADLAGLTAAAKRCEGCPLFRDATQTVFGRGPANARVMLVGEQPGDQEDLRDAPFVGPAGEVLDRALREAALDRDSLYVTHAVKHFKFVMRAKR